MFWNILLKNSGIHIPLKENFLIYFAGFALSVSPGKSGELLKSILLKNKFMKIESFNDDVVFSDKISTKVILETPFSKEIRIVLKILYLTKV